MRMIITIFSRITDVLIMSPNVTRYSPPNAYASELTLQIEPIVNGKNSLQLSQGKNPTFTDVFNNLYEPKWAIQEVDIWVQECEFPLFSFANLKTHSF